MKTERRLEEQEEEEHQLKKPKEENPGFDLDTRA